MKKLMVLRPPAIEACRCTSLRSVSRPIKRTVASPSALLSAWPRMSSRMRPSAPRIGSMMTWGSLSARPSSRHTRSRPPSAPSSRVRICSIPRAVVRMWTSSAKNGSSRPFLWRCASAHSVSVITAGDRPSTVTSALAILVPPLARGGIVPRPALRRQLSGPFSAALLAAAVAAIALVVAVDDRDHRRR